MLKRFFVVAALGLSAVACGNECDDAEDKLEECLGELPEGGPEGDEECSEQAECGAKCTNDASCDDIKALFEEGNFQTSYGECLAGCA